VFTQSCELIADIHSYAVKGLKSACWGEMAANNYNIPELPVGDMEMLI
jgi:hypothetical protein